MADHQRIHPVDLEAGQPRPTAPLVPSGSFRSDKGHPPAAQPDTRPLPPPPRRTVPPMPPLPPPKRRRSRASCCCRLLCCIIATAVILAVLVAAALGALYLAFNPKAPRYSVYRLSVTQFQVDPATLTATAAFEAALTASNPNARIGIFYERGSSLSVWYESVRLARGALPAFYQGHRNTTTLGVAMAGQAQLGGAVVSAMRDAQRTGAVPLVFRADVPVRVELGTLKLWTVTSRVRCDLVVDSILNAGSNIKIKASNCKFGFKLI